MISHFHPNDVRMMARIVAEEPSDIEVLKDRMYYVFIHAVGRLSGESCQIASHPTYGSEERKAAEEEADVIASLLRDALTVTMIAEEAIDP